MQKISRANLYKFFDYLIYVNSNVRLFDCSLLPIMLFVPVGFVTQL